MSGHHLRDQLKRLDGMRRRLAAQRRRTSESLTPEEAHAVVLAGRTVRVVVGPDPRDPICLHYIDRHEDKPMIYGESVAGWSEGTIEAICAAGDPFYLEFIGDPSLTLTEEKR